ncbi:GNAT family N-acetyltransferase [Oceanobacillus sp. 143]|uniref:GNAT family N-acetyltransferase n=1 Tax=Oceanobacillus zhaokaii TaxID=2052660 RepID=A0A345PFK9_9BACI|nr:GNAT family N-acetyltransferase [Oceanobacillus zhaokaii]AXI08789.1 GNAT family N-acetyltransferase [Oceanobacillus zhaokaii]QGS68496.1 GNAT family N-acetyltransferase [Oceanobacillus sp. 143]
MNWYEKLNKYFPIEEMKSKQHMELLLEDTNGHYQKDESPEHVMMYAEFDTCIFIDYLWVSAETRGQGTGHKLIEKLKKKKKPILLEVEPVDPNEIDTEKRLKFYQREGFKHAASIIFQNRSFQTKEIAPLEILYWSVENEGQAFIFEQMKKIYQSIHSYKSIEIYGRELGDVEEVLQLDKNRITRNLLTV